MDFLQAGVNLIYIRDLLGHSDVATTEVYARADTEMKRQALEAVHIPAWSRHRLNRPKIRSFCNGFNFLASRQPRRLM